AYSQIQLRCSGSYNHYERSYVCTTHQRPLAKYKGGVSECIETPPFLFLFTADTMTRSCPSLLKHIQLGALFSDLNLRKTHGRCRTFNICNRALSAMHLYVNAAEFNLMHS